MSNAKDAAEPRILIIGAGIVGLTLAQALKKNGVSFSIYERDEHSLSRGAGWGLTLHWCLPHFLSLLPQELVDRLEETYVDPSLDAAKGTFPYIELTTGTTMHNVPPAPRIRVQRERLRRLLMHGIDIQWSKKLIGMEESKTGEGVIARFEDDTSARGSLVLGCDGSHSRVRALMCPEIYRNHELDIRLLGVTVEHPVELANQMRDLDPFFLQGSDKNSDVFFWFSFLDNPPKSPTRTCQILLSWPYRRGFRGQSEPLEVPSSQQRQIALMKEMAATWSEPFRSVVCSIPDDADVKPLKLEDWEPPAEPWTEALGGRVGLLGDAAHAMVMYRGEAANYGIEDVHELLQLLLPLLKKQQQGDSSTHAREGNESTPSDDRPCGSIREALRRFGSKTTPGRRKAVLASRKACYDAHNYEDINGKSPLLSRRIMMV